MADVLSARRDLWEAGAAMRSWHEDLFRHSLVTADLAAAAARTLGFPEREAELARLGGFLHDFGKVTWPRELVSKYPLTEEDWQIIRMHPIVGARLVRERVPDVSWVVLRVIEEHHERDGDGYPRGKRAGDLHPLSRVVACVECFTALLEGRPYRLESAGGGAPAEQFLAAGFERELVEAVRKVASENGLGRGRSTFSIQS